MNKEGAIASMLVGLISTFSYIYYFKFVYIEIAGRKAEEDWWFGISPEGIGFLFMWLALAVGVMVSLATKAPPAHIQTLVEDIRVPGQRRPHGPDGV